MAYDSEKQLEAGARHAKLEGEMRNMARKMFGIHTQTEDRPAFLEGAQLDVSTSKPKRIKMDASELLADMCEFTDLDKRLLQLMRGEVSIDDLRQEVIDNYINAHLNNLHELNEEIE